jgi:hypothetical protein
LFVDSNATRQRRVSGSLARGSWIVVPVFCGLDKLGNNRRTGSGAASAELRLGWLGLITPGLRPLDCANRALPLTHRVPGFAHIQIARRFSHEALDRWTGVPIRVRYHSSLRDTQPFTGTVNPPGIVTRAFDGRSSHVQWIFRARGGRRGQAGKGALLSNNTLF